MLKRAGRVVFFLGAVLVVSIDLQPQSLREAARLDAEGKCDEAEVYYRAALAQGPPSQPLLNNAGNHYLVCGQTAKAQAYFEKLLQLNPTHSNANLQLARLATEQKQGKRALEYLTRVKESDPTVLLLRAEALHWAGRPTESLTILDNMQHATKADPRLLLLLGLSCARLALYDRAEVAFNAALAHQPEDFDILFSLGKAAARAQHYDRAQRALEAALKIRPENVDLLLELGRVAAARQDYIRAFFVLAQARQKTPGRVDVLLMLARAAQDAGYYEDSATTYDEYLRLRPDDDSARRDRARAYGYTESRWEEARKELDWYLRKHPDDPLGHYVFAQVFWWPEPEKSLAHLSEAVRLEPNSVTNRFSRAWMLQRLGKMAESLKDLEVANRLLPGNVRILDLMSLAYLALEQPAEAEKVSRQALSKEPENPEVNLHMGRALMSLGREEEAKAFMDQYQKIRPQALPRVRKPFGMIELATLTAKEQRAQQIERFRRDAREHPERPDYQLQLASLLLADSQKTEALREFRTLLGLNANSRIWAEAGALLLSSQEYSLAREFLQHASEERPSSRLDLALALLYLEGPEPALRSLEKTSDGELSGDGLLLKAYILEAAGRNAEAEKLLDVGLHKVSTKPQVVQQAVMMLLRLERKKDALNLLEQAIPANPQDSDLPLTKAIVLGLMDRHAAAEKVLQEIELRWPEWDRAYLAHGLLLERSSRTGEARQKLQIAAALASQDSGVRCALGRLTGAPSPAPECACLRGLEQLLVPQPCATTLGE
jgi:tetratricopeptide (TPR) repeat protein